MKYFIDLVYMTPKNVISYVIKLRFSPKMLMEGTNSEVVLSIVIYIYCLMGVIAKV